MHLPTLAAVLLIALSGCKSEPPPAQVHGSSVAAPAPEGTPPLPAADRTAKFAIGLPRGDVKTKTDEELCVDRFLVEHKLNAYGDPEGTAYTGGTPLFDEMTGKRTDRLTRVYAQQPEAKALCHREAPKDP